MSQKFYFTDSNSTPWRKSSLTEGVEVKDLGTANGMSMQLVRFAPGTIFPIHTHEGPEFVYMIDGSAVQNGKTLKAGWGSVAEVGTIDENFHSPKGCIFLTVYKN